jgi:hypothetical protein
LGTVAELKIDCREIAIIESAARALRANWGGALLLPTILIRRDWYALDVAGGVEAG